MAVLHVTEENFEKEVLQAQKPVLIDFWASWCGPCQMLAPVIEEIAEEVTDVIVGKVNVDEEAALAQKFDIMSIPTLLLFKNGQVVATTMGAQPKENLLQFMRQ